MRRGGGGDCGPSNRCCWCPPPAAGSQARCRPAPTTTSATHLCCIDCVKLCGCRLEAAACLAGQGGARQALRAPQRRRYRRRAAPAGCAARAQGCRCRKAKLPQAAIRQLHCMQQGGKGENDLVKQTFGGSVRPWDTSRPPLAPPAASFLVWPLTCAAAKEAAAGRAALARHAWCAVAAKPRAANACATGAVARARRRHAATSPPAAAWAAASALPATPGCSERCSSR
jgi:hypothetical protein